MERLLGFFFFLFFFTFISLVFLSEFFCGLCEDGVCIPHPNITTEQECNSTFGCVLANGEVKYTQDEDECLNMMSCTVKCIGEMDFEECKSEEECVTTGDCGDDKLALGVYYSFL